MRPELDNSLQCLSLNGYSVFSLLDDILSHGCNLNQDLGDQRAKLLREGTERDAANICARLLGHNTASTSVFSWALGAVQSALRVEEITRMEHAHRFMADHNPLSLPNNNVLSPGLSSGTAWTPIDGSERILNFGRVQFRVKNYRQAVTIDMVPDNVFLEIFNFCLSGLSTYPIYRKHERTKKWQRLVHVCQRWRRIIFASPRRLDLRLSCSYGTPVRKNLVFWPVSLPLAVDYPPDLVRLSPMDEDNIVAALEHPGRVHRVCILVGSSLLRRVATLIQKSFPALTHLDLVWNLDDLKAPFSSGVLAFPGIFLGGSAPRLRSLRLNGVSFLGLPTFLLSARNLVTLKIKEICQNGYIPPEAMVGSLAALTRLTTLSISFYDEESLPEQRTRPPDPPMRTILPALTDFHYRGCSEYLDDFLAQIDTPRVDNLRIEYFMHQIQAPQLSRFIDRTENLRIDQFRSAEVIFFSEVIYVEFDYPQGECRQARISLKILGQDELDLQVPCVVDILGQLAAVFSNVDHLISHGDHVTSGDIDLEEWLPFFHLFPAVEALHLSGGVAAAYIASALEETADSEQAVTDVFPALRLIWLDDDDDDDDDYKKPIGSIKRFLSLRRLSGRPVTVVDTEDGFVNADRRPL